MATDKLINQSQGDDIINALDDIATGVGNLSYGEQTSSDKVVAMTGYQKESTAAAISPGDSLNVAIGKLEKKVDDKVTGPSSAVVGNIATFANVDGKSVQDSEVAIVTTMDDESDAEVPTSEAIGEYIADQKFAVGLDSSTANHLVKFKDNNGKNLEDTGIAVETSSASALSDDDVHIPTSKLVKTEVDKKVTSIKAPVSGSSTKVDKDNEVAFQQASGQSPAVTVTGDATNGTVTIEHQTGSGFNHLPKSGADGKYLKWKTGDDGEWVAPDSTWPANPDNKTIPGTKLVDDRFDTDEANILYNLNTGVRNICTNAEYSDGTKTAQNTTFTTLADGTVTVKTPSGQTSTTDTNNFYNVWFENTSTVLIPEGTWICKLYGTDISNIRIEYSYILNGTTTTTKGNFGEAFEMTIPTGISASWLRICAKPSTSFDSSFKIVVCNKAAWEADPPTEYIPFAKSNYQLTAEIGDKLDKTEKGAVSGVAELDANGKVPSSQLPSSMTPSSHTHGSITNDGTITAAGVALASGDSFVFVDSSDSSKIKKTSVTFDGSTTTKALTPKGTFETFLQSHQTVKQDGVTGATANRFGTCSTAAATAAKTVSITSGTFNLEAGARVSVKFTNANTADTPTLNVNSKGAKNIYSKGSQITTGSNKSLLAGTVDFIYDGTQWHLIGNYIDTNTTYSSKSAASGGTDVSLCTTGEKYTWNSKAAGDHTHPLTLAADSGTVALTLAHNTGYKLTAGGNSFIFKTPADNNTYPSAYCSTAAATAAKVATCTGYALLSKSYIHVIITTANTSASALTLNINSKGAKPIYINGSASSSSNYTLPAGSYLVYYNGTNYYFRTDGKVTAAGIVDIGGNTGKYFKGDGTLVALPTASTSAAGIVQLSNSLTSTSQTVAATSYAVKQINDTIGNINSVLEAVL